MLRRVFQPISLARNFKEGGIFSEDRILRGKNLQRGGGFVGGIIQGEVHHEGRDFFLEGEPD